MVAGSLLIAEPRPASRHGHHLHRRSTFCLPSGRGSANASQYVLLPVQIRNWTDYGVPAFAATHSHPSLTSLFRAMLGKLPRDEYTYMTVRQRIDFAIMTVIFGILVGVCVTRLAAADIDI